MRASISRGTIELSFDRGNFHWAINVMYSLALCYLKSVDSHLYILFECFFSLSKIKRFDYYLKLFSKLKCTMKDSNTITISKFLLSTVIFYKPEFTIERKWKRYSMCVHEPYSSERVLSGAKWKEKWLHSFESTLKNLMNKWNWNGLNSIHILQLCESLPSHLLVLPFPHHHS